MKMLKLSDVVVVDRHRTDLGDLGPLAESIRENGLLHPIVVTPAKRLVAGQRRMEACRLLGFGEVPVTVVTNLTSAASLLRAELDENVCRKEMTPAERKALTDRLLELERPAAKERQGHGATAPGKNASGPGTRSVGNAGDIAAKAAGWSRTSYERTKRVLDAATDPTAAPEVRAAAQTAAAGMEAGTVTVKEAASSVARARIVHAPSRRPVAERADQIRGLTDRGYSASQIAKEIGVGEQQVRKIATEVGITLVDTALGRRRRVDPNRVIDTTVSSLEGIAIGVDVVEVADLDPERVEQWATSLSNSLRSLNRLAKQLKEMARGQE